MPTVPLSQAVVAAPAGARTTHSGAARSKPASKKKVMQSRRARPRNRKPSRLCAVARSPPLSSPPSEPTDEIDALVTALAESFGAQGGVDSDDILRILSPQAAAEARDASSASASTSSSPSTPSPPSTSTSKRRRRGPAALLKNLLASSAPDAQAAASGTVRLLQSLDDDDGELFFGSGDESGSESDGEEFSAAAAAASVGSGNSVVGPRLRAELGTLVLKAFETAAGMTSETSPDAAAAASRGRLTRDALSALLSRAGVVVAKPPSPSPSGSAAAVDDILLRYGLRDSSRGGGELYLNYAGFLRLLRDQAADLRAVLRFASLGATEREGEASLALTPPDSPASSSPSVYDAVASPFEPRRGAVSLVFGGDDLDAACSAAGPGSLICLQASFTWCSPCKRFASTYAAFAAAYENITFLKFHGNSNEATKALFKERLKVPETPAFALIRDGQLVAPLVLGANAQRLADALSAAASSDAGAGRGEDPMAGASELERSSFMSRLTAGTRKV